MRIQPVRVGRDYHLHDNGSDGRKSTRGLVSFTRKWGFQPQHYKSSNQSNSFRSRVLGQKLWSAFYSRDRINLEAKTRFSELRCSYCCLWI